MFYLTTHSTHFIYCYMASNIWLRTILKVRKETRCRHIGYSYRLTARVLLYAPSHRQDSTYHGLCYTSRGTLAGTRNSSMGPPHEGSIRRPIAPWANALPLSYVPLPGIIETTRGESCCYHCISYSFQLTKDLLYCHPRDRIAHTTAFVTPVVEHWLEWGTELSVKHNSLLGGNLWVGLPDETQGCSRNGRFQHSVNHLDDSISCSDVCLNDLSAVHVVLGSTRVACWDTLH